MIDYRLTLEYEGRFITLSDEDEPEGLSEIEFTLKRDPNFHGVLPELSTKLKFHSSGYTFIKAAYDEFGIEPVMRCLIEVKETTQWNTLFDGIIDLIDAKFTDRFVECDIKTASCLDTFMARMEKQVNLYDEPCFTELTEDRTAYRTRYRYAPYSLEMPEVEMTGLTTFELDPTFTPGSSSSIRRFAFDGGVGCTLFLCDGGPVPCGYSTVCNNETPNGNLNKLYLYQGFPVISNQDDLEILSGGSNINDWMQEARACDFTDVMNDEIFRTQSARRWDIEEDNIGIAPPCLCHSYEVSYSVKGSFQILLQLNNAIPTFPFFEPKGVVEYIRVTPRVVFRWGRMDGLGNFVGYERSVFTGTPIEFDNGCVPLAGIDIAPATDFLIPDVGTFDVSDSFFIDCAQGEIYADAKMGIYVEYQIAGIFEGDGLGSGRVVTKILTNFESAEGQIISKTCLPGMEPVGVTTTNAYMLHEVFSRLSEHYTNNCLRVKSDFFGRPDSMEWADICEIQNPPDTSGCENVLDCDCQNPTDFPQCNLGFDPTPFQTSTYGCGSATILTSGTNLRQSNRALFVSFEELFKAADAVWAIGMGWTADEPDVLRIENWEYFYQQNIILDLEIDEYNAKATSMPSGDYYFNRFQFGYKSWLTEKFNTKDVYHATREYGIEMKNVMQGLERYCEFVADAYAIEFQRRQIRISNNSEFDDSKFFICVGKTRDTNNTVTINTTQGPVTYPNHVFIAEQGVENAINIPFDTLNYRIAPSNIIDRWLRWLSIGMWTKPTVPFKFAKGEVNYEGGGENLPNHLTCENDKQFFENDPYPTSYTPIFPEVLEFEYPLTPYEFQTIRTNPYSLILVNKKPYYLLEVQFVPNRNSKLKLLKAIYEYI